MCFLHSDNWFLIFCEVLTEDLICILVSLNEQKFSIAILHLGDLGVGGQKTPQKWTTSVPILKNLWWFCHLWYSFCYWQKCPEYVGLLFVPQICCEVSASVAFTSLCHSSPTRPCKISKNQPKCILWAVPPLPMHEDDWRTQVSQENSLSPHVWDSDGHFPWLCESGSRCSGALGRLSHCDRPHFS